MRFALALLLSTSLYAADPVATFSILGYDPETGEVGGAVQSRVFSVGNGVLWAEAGVGAVATQAIIDVSYGPQGLELLRKGVAPADAVKRVHANDPDPRPDDWTKEGRQFAIMDARGSYAAFTGPKATEWAGHKGGKFCTAQGNILAGPAVVEEMVKAFENTKGHLSYRLLAALDAGHAAGGDKRGMQSAAILIVKKNGGVWLNNDVVMRLQVDDDPQPLKELRRLIDRAAKQRDGVRVTTIGLHPWGELAMRDIEAMRTQILENHPGPVDPLNPGFRKWLDDGYEQALAKARDARTFGGYASALEFYGAGFRDGHLQAGVMLDPRELWWPRFIVRLRNGRYVVAANADEKDATLPPVGAELLDCDSRSAKMIVEQDLWPYAQGPMIESAWPIVAADLLIDRGNPWAPRARTCRFRVGDETRELAIQYARGNDSAIAAASRRAFVPLAPLPPVRTVASGGLWVSIPSFSDWDEGAVTRLRELVAKAPEWRNAPFIVFDVRTNGGGNSRWGEQILEGLYGTPFRAYAIDPHFAKQMVDWRTSKDNIAHVRGFGAGFAGVAEGMEKAAAEGQVLWHRAATPEPAAPKAEPLFRGKVVLLTDRRCASACLDFADRVRLLPNAIHAGLATSADSVYMEVRPVELPSGVGRLGLPVKVYRDRPRGHNEPYVPQAVYEGDINDTAAVEQWVLESVLTRR
ncbi:MAG TPA: DUF1028 domain-containing protein [Thermoanaerobaculia bacterium]|nr:DUF1028 domain-containing protein [Thermoanaerobaculia bacterium]